MDYEDGMMTSYPEAQLREELTIYIRRYQPNVVMSWFPYPLFSLQPSLGWVDLGWLRYNG
jgi:LmbE family N-acetylglucosaminyl deacetylase